MYIPSVSLLVIMISIAAFVGLFMGWVAHHVRHGTGLGLTEDLLFGVVGALAGRWFLPQLEARLGASFIIAIFGSPFVIVEVFDPAIGAILLISVVRLLCGGWERLRRRR